MRERIEGGKTAFDRTRVYIPEPLGAHMPKSTALWQYRIRSPKTLWTFWALPMALRRDRPLADVVFSPTHYIPRFTPVPKVMAIMDVSYLTYPELFRPQDLHKLLHWTAYSVAHAAAIITISAFSKNAIIEAYNVPEERITVAYPALSDVVGRTTTMVNNATRTTVPKRYILSVGTLQPRKNYARLIEAFSRLADHGISLCIVGKKGWLYEDILAGPKRFGVSDRVRFLDFVPDAELQSLYRNAELFVLPSLYEGFGLPVLEAMVHGVPVVVSKTSSLPEIAGKAGIYVDPSDVQSITVGMSQGLAEKGTKEEAARTALGKKLAKQFTWDAAADKVLAVLTDVGKRGRP
jgi:glycosyltransferase involved in cell wall biosynthesis